MSMLPPFTPGPTVNVSAGATATAATAIGKPLNQDKQVLVTVPAGGSQVLSFIKFGDSSVAATTSDTPLMPGTAMVFTCGAAQTHFSVIGSAAGPTTVYVTSGQGE
jgi:hypothetical protein